jgi:hypothetical protein
MEKSFEEQVLSVVKIALLKGQKFELAGIFRDREKQVSKMKTSAETNTPITYTEEEVKELIKKWDIHVNSDPPDASGMEQLIEEIDNFWNQNKKK